MDGMEWRVCLALNESEIHDRKRGARADGRGGGDAMYVSAGASARDAKLPLAPVFYSRPSGTGSLLGWLGGSGLRLRACSVAPRALLSLQGLRRCLDLVRDFDSFALPSLNSERAPCQARDAATGCARERRPSPGASQIQCGEREMR